MSLEFMRLCNNLKEDLDFIGYIIDINRIIENRKNVIKRLN
jgi:hypothetical protein